MKQIYDVVLVANTDKQAFVDSFDSDTQADWWNMMSEMPTLICMHVEDSFLETFKQDPRIVKVEERLTPFPASLPAFHSITKNVWASTSTLGTSNNGADYMPLQFYVDTDIIQSSQTVGANDQTNTISNATYQSRWTGKHVDIVTLEVGPVNSSRVGYHDSHPDFDDPDNPGTSRWIPMDWQDLEEASNNQVTSNSCVSDHGAGVLSVAGGSICGFAKKANLRAAYLSTGDGVVECVNAITAWHNNKGVNSTTGVKNPTIMIAEYQYVRNRARAVLIDDVQSITTPSGTINRPGGSWGTDFTSFVNNGIMPFKVLDPNTTTWNWCCVFPEQGVSVATNTALEAAWDAGIININAAGNDSGVYVKYTDSRFQGTYCTTSGTITQYSITSDNDVTKTTTTTSKWYPFYSYNPIGSEKGIDVAAGQNSETHPVLDAYTVRGPGIDIVGLGSYTWSAYPSLQYNDGYRFGNFSGTSCATPTVVGKMACLLERYFTYNGQYPTPNQAKQILLAEAQEIVKDVSSTTWNSVPSASTDYSNSEIAGTKNKLNHIQDGYWSANGGLRFLDLLGTTNKRAYHNAHSFDRKHTQGRRPISGPVYPRPRRKRKG